MTGSEGFGDLRFPRAALLAVLVVTTACEPAQATRSHVCWVDTSGIEVDATGRHVTDIVTARCEVPPRSHTIEAWLEYKPGKGGEWTMPRFPARSSVIPDAEGVSLLVTLPCKAGRYRAAWRTTGRGPAVEGHPSGIPFDVPDADFGSTRVDADECGAVN